MFNWEGEPEKALLISGFAGRISETSFKFDAKFIGPSPATVSLN
jgi:hypothetical protein